MKSQVLHTVWCHISCEAAGEFWHWSLLGVKGLILMRRTLSYVNKSYLSTCCNSARCDWSLTEGWSFIFRARRKQKRDFMRYQTWTADKREQKRTQEQVVLSRPPSASANGCVARACACICVARFHLTHIARVFVCVCVTRSRLTRIFRACPCVCVARFYLTHITFRSFSLDAHHLCLRRSLSLDAHLLCLHLCLRRPLQVDTHLACLYSCLSRPFLLDAHHFSFIFTWRTSLVFALVFASPVLPWRASLVRNPAKAWACCHSTAASPLPPYASPRVVKVTWRHITHP